MDIKLIKQVVDLMKRSELSEFELEEEGFKLRLSRQTGETQIIQAAPYAAPMAAAPAAAPSAAALAPAAPVEEVGISVVKSPMVGTFYTAASPESSSVFAKVGGKGWQQTPPSASSKP